MSFVGVNSGRASLPDLSIRRGCSADDPVCGRIIGLAIAAGPLPDALPFARLVLTSTAPLPLPPGRRRLLARQAGTVVGFADVDCERAVLNYLFILPERQGQGIGTALLATAERATIRVAGRPPTLTVLTANAPARGFYRARGYAEIARWREPDWHGGPVDWLRLKSARAPYTNRPIE